MQIHQEIPVVPEGITRKSFCQYVCMLFLSWNVLDRNRLRPYTLPNEVESHVDVLSSCRAKRIVGESDYAFVVYEHLDAILRQRRNDER